MSCYLWNQASVQCSPHLFTTEQLSSQLTSLVPVSLEFALHSIFRNVSNSVVQTDSCSARGSGRPGHLDIQFTIRLMSNIRRHIHPQPVLAPILQNSTHPPGNSFTLNSFTIITYYNLVKNKLLKSRRISFKFVYKCLSEFNNSCCSLI